MNILLINPPRSPHNGIWEHAGDEARRFVHRKLIGPPLGLLTIAGAVRDHDVTVLEMKAEYDLFPDAPPPTELVRQYLEQTNPRVVGVTFVASEFPAGMEILRTVKTFNPHILTVVGGVHATLCPHDFSTPAVDVVCLGPSAHTFRRIIEAIDSATSLDDVDGILVNREGNLLPTSAPLRDCDPVGEHFVLPDRSHLAKWLPAYIVGRTNGPGTYVFTSLGCPYKCSFCSIWPQLNGRYLQRPVESVLQELKTLDDYIAVRFADANSLGDVRAVEQLFDRIIEEDIRKIFIMDIRVDTAAKNPRLIEKLARAGLKVVITGFESFRQDELRGYNKDLAVELIEEGIRVFHANDIMVRGNYVVPPHYGDDDFKELAEFASQRPVSFAGYTILTPFPGTAFYEEMRDRIIDHDLAKYNLFNCVLKPRLPLDEFYERLASLWLIRKGTDVL